MPCIVMPSIIMRRRSVVTGLLFIGATLVAPALAAQRAATPALMPAQSRVMAVVDSAMAAINSGDMIALSDLMTDSAQVYAARLVGGKPAFTMRTAASQRATGKRAPIIERGFDLFTLVQVGAA